MIEKNILRKKMKEIRDGLSESYRKEAANSCHLKILESSLYKEVDWVYVYISFGSELDTRGLISTMLDQGKRVAVPKIQDGRMDFYEIRSLEECRPGVWGIPEPLIKTPQEAVARDGEEGSGQAPCQKECVSEPGLMLLPGLAFDQEGNRLGYGGGYYDRYLASHPGHSCCGLAYKEQILDRLPTDEYDKKVDYLFIGP